MKKLNDFLNDYKDYKKIMHDSSTLVRCTLYNTYTKKVVNFIVDDYEYQYGGGLINRDYDLETLEYIRYNMKIDAEALEHYKKHILKEIGIGSKIEVVKGRKYQQGLQGTVKKLYTYIVPNTYNRVQVEYVILETGEKIDIKNIKLIEC